MPVFTDQPDTEAGKLLKGLEIGRELSYFKSRTSSKPGAKLQGEETKEFVINSSDARVTLVTGLQNGTFPPCQHE
jgi:hypothetical protein